MAGRTLRGIGLALMMGAAPGSPPVHAQYLGPLPTATTVSQIVAAPVNHQVVVLRGFIVRQVDPELYVFKDQTGEIVLEIDPETFPRSPVKPDTAVQIRGDVEVGWKDGPRIEVEDLFVLPAAK
jgi:uncharacterized protein (TIGR00156 family)